MSHLISLDTAVVVTGVTKRTLWRWLGSGAIEHRGMDERGRAMLAYADIKPKLCISFADAEDIELLVEAAPLCQDSCRPLLLNFLN